MHTKDRLAAELRKIGLRNMARLAEAGRYDDFLSESATPLLDLIQTLGVIPNNPDAWALRTRVMNGEFDATPEESEAWAASPEGQETMRRLMGGKK